MPWRFPFHNRRWLGPSIGKRFFLEWTLIGVVGVAAVLFGALIQGGSELSFEIPHINRDMVIVIQGLVILFCGALENLFRRPLLSLWKRTP